MEAGGGMGSVFCGVEAVGGEELIGDLVSTRSCSGSPSGSFGSGVGGGGGGGGGARALSSLAVYSSLIFLSLSSTSSSGLEPAFP